MSSRRDFLKLGGAVALGGAASSACQPATNGGPAATASTTGDSARMLAGNTHQPARATFDRLPREWHEATVKKFQQKLGERGLGGALITDRWNIIYLTGLFHTTTERPFACFIPADELAVHWFYPGLDKALVRSWWFTDGDYYYDYPHAEGGYPDQGTVATGPPVDLVAFQLKGIEKRGYGDKGIGLDESPSMRKLEHMKQILPRARFEEVGDVLMKMRWVKTPEELALSQRAYDYFSQIHAWTRDYILQHGTDLTDFQIANAAAKYGTDLIMKDIKRDGRPHTAVGIEIDIACRTGVGNAYPHPNQFHHNRVQKGDSLQVAGVVQIGGCGGELYCPYQVAPWKPEWERTWEVMAEASRMQIEMSKAGAVCQNIAKAIHAMQVDKEMQDLLYQRVAHGEGMEGHQPPYIALGDQTVLEEGMTFSMEPGLFYPEQGYGYNPSDNVVVGRDTGWVQGSVPNLTKEWALLKL
jgi:Xaa-Pro aminopeptidase